MNNQKGQEGSVLIISLAISAVILILLGIFLGTIVAEKRRQQRSFRSNQAFNLAEAGIEYGIWALNNEDITTWDKDEAGDPVTSFTVNTSGEKIGCSTVAITSSTIAATITSTGSVSYDSANIDREVTINAENVGAFIFDSAIVGVNGVTISGGGHVWGDVVVGPGVTPPATADVTGDIEVADSEIELPAVSPPSSFDYYNYDDTYNISSGETRTISSGGIYKYDSMKVNGTLEINATGASVIIYVEGNVNINGEIRIASGCSVSLYVGGNTSIAGNGVVNESRDPSKFVLYGSGKCDLTGSSDFYGVVYAPEVNIKVTGGAKVYGCLIGNTVKVSGGGEVHYDERVADLANASLFKNFKFKPHSWR